MLNKMSESVRKIYYFSNFNWLSVLKTKIDMHVIFCTTRGKSRINKKVSLKGKTLELISSVMVASSTVSKKCPK